MRELLAEVDWTLARGQACVWCAVVQTRGSTPQKAGAAMLVFPDGRTVGTIGGSAAVSAVQQASTIPAPPSSVTDSVTNLGAWQAVGQGLVSFARFVATSPIEVGAIVLIVIGVWFAPKCLPYLWRQQS